VVLAIHEMLLAEHGGQPGVLDEGLLDAALAAPKNHFAYEEADPFRLAAIYAHGLTQNHPFADGNKRVALTVAGVFLELNGFRLDAPEQEAASAMNGLSDRSVSRDEFADWLKASCSPISPP
jgi:death-on-curing protein